MDRFWRDFKHSLRGLAGNPGFTVASVLTLALGIGAATAIFSVVHGVVLRPLPFREPDRLVAVWETNLERDFAKSRTTAANYLDWRVQNQVFEEMGVFGARGFNLTGRGEPELLRGARVSAGYFRALGVEPIAGRTFLPEENEPGGERAVVLSHGLWRSRFGAETDIVGRSILLNDDPYIVVGVMPSGVYPSWPSSTGKMRFLPQYHQIWVPMVFDDRLRGERGSHLFGVVARLRVGFSRQQAQAEMDTIAHRLEREYPVFNKGMGIRLDPLADEVVGDVRLALFVLLGAVALVLLIACANTASLLLARGSARHKEIAIRTALGAGRLELVRQLLVESLVLGLLGGGVGIFLAKLGISGLTRLSPQELPRLSEVGIDLTVLVFALFLSLLAGLLFGLTPALQLARRNFNEALKEGGRSSGQGSTRPRLRPLLVIAEVGLAVTLVIGAALLIKSFRRLMEVDPGFRAGNILVVDLVLSPTKYSEWHQISSFHSRLLEQIRSMPGVRHAALGYDHPLETNWYDDFLIEGRPDPQPGETPLAIYRPVGVDYFRTLGITLARGRPFGERDDPDHPGAVIINESLAARHFPDEDPIGRRFLVDGPSYPWGDAMPGAFEIVGIVSDVRFFGLARESEPAFYLPARQHPLPDMSVFVGTERDPLELVESLRREVWALDPDQPIAQVTTMDDVLGASVAQPRFNTLVLGLFGVAALLLAAVGIYGLLSYTVSHRTHEIGLRIALGARGRDMIHHFVGRALVLASVGIGLGLAGAVALTRVVGSLLYGVSTTDPETFAGVALFAALVAGLASYVPARRAARVDCMVALRYE